MATRIGRYTLNLDNQPRIIGFASVAGKKEGDGPLSEWFDHTAIDDKMGQDSYEKAESQFIKTAMDTAIKKAGIKAEQLDTVFGGDLLNQCIGTAYAVRDYAVPFVGLYGACSTMAEGLCLASLFADTKLAQRVMAVTSSHFCSSERQFRYPLEYGGVRPPTSQWTVTGSGASVVSLQGEGVKVKRVLIGRITDLGICDINNMGAAMAPAAADTIMKFFEDTGEKPQNYDAIFTGDLGFVGSELLIQLLKKEGIDISKNHKDCGCMIFDRERQDVHAGGSGCGCSATVLNGYILNSMMTGKLKRVLFAATGALMSTTSFQQGESIPGISHLVELSV
ncbi:MAG: stage V sporulation protein AD [Clostridia bacterium]|nr:stage V sporulation protein AD [Clostridia bacterium]